MHFLTKIINFKIPNSTKHPNHLFNPPTLVIFLHGMTFPETTSKQLFPTPSWPSRPGMINLFTSRVVREGFSEKRERAEKTCILIPFRGAIFRGCGKSTLQKEGNGQRKLIEINLYVPVFFLLAGKRFFLWKVKKVFLPGRCH